MVRVWGRVRCGRLALAGHVVAYPRRLHVVTPRVAHLVRGRGRVRLTWSGFRGRPVVAPRVAHTDELALAILHAAEAALGQVDEGLGVDRLVRVVHLEALHRAVEVMAEQIVGEEAGRVHEGTHLPRVLG